MCPTSMSEIVDPSQFADVMPVEEAVRRSAEYLKAQF